MVISGAGLLPLLFVVLGVASVVAAFFEQVVTSNVDRATINRSKMILAPFAGRYGIREMDEIKTIKALQDEVNKLKGVIRENQEVLEGERENLV